LQVIGPDSDFFAPLLVDAALRVKTTNTRGVSKYPLKAINVLKCHGKSLKETQFVPGYALNCTAASQGTCCRLPMAALLIARCH
jgi:T-complex protein 1 subunit alpha